MKTTFNKEKIRSEFSKAWKDADMTNYCTNQVAAVAVLPDGGIVTVDKQRIEKNFCFGESGYDFDEAQKSAAHARKSESYFKSENMQAFRERINALREMLDGTSRDELIIFDQEYIGQTEDCKLRGIRFVRLWEVLDACGGSARISDLPGMRLQMNNNPCRVATREDIQVILSAYEAAAAAHEKKVDAYLKRYGLSQVRAWTYWRDE